MTETAKRSLEMHKKLRGKLEIKARAEVKSKEALSLAYTPGVAQPCLEIQKDPDLSLSLQGAGTQLLWLLMVPQCLALVISDPKQACL